MLNRKPRLCLITQNNYCLRAFLLPQIKTLVKFYDISVVVNDNINIAKSMLPAGVDAYRIKISRDIAVFSDLRALILLIQLFLTIHPDIVHSTTPKCGLLAMLAGCLTSIKVRIHTFTGQVWQNRNGLTRSILKFTDKLIFLLATRILCDSHGQMAFLIDEGIITEGHSAVLLNGSICGVEKFISPPKENRAVDFRTTHGIPRDSVIFLYMARFTVDKGALVVANAFAKLKKCVPHSHLIMVGPDEENLEPEIRKICKECLDSLTVAEYSSDPSEFFSESDVFCLPSFREGLPMVVLNASNAGLPVVVSRIYGSMDAVIENKTALVFEPGNHAELTAKLVTLATNADLRKRLGEEGQKFVAENFCQTKIIEELRLLYENSLEGGH